MTPEVKSAAGLGGFENASELQIHEVTIAVKRHRIRTGQYPDDIMCGAGISETGLPKKLHRLRRVSTARPGKTAARLAKTVFEHLPASRSCAIYEQERPTELFLVRNLGNLNTSLSMPGPTNMGDYELRKKLGLNIDWGGGHNLIQYLPPEKYFEQHSEYYVFKDGQRRKPAFGGTFLTQLCFTNQAMWRAFTENFLAEVRAHRDFTMFCIMIEDNRILCDCPECLNPIVLPDGTTVQPEDPAFRSTQFFLFLNSIAGEFQTEFPDKKLMTYAYFFTTIPPKVQVAKNVVVEFCPLGSRDDKPIYDPINSYFHKPLLAWMERGIGLRWREYYSLANRYPRPIADKIKLDYLYLQKYGNVEIYIENPPDHTSTWYPDCSECWDSNAMEMWIMLRLAWTPESDVPALRKEYIARVYGTAAEEMAAYYNLIHGSWQAANPPSHWYHNSRLYWAGLVYYQGLEAPCRQLLEQAAAKITNPESAKFLAAHRRLFESALAMVKKTRLEAARCVKPPSFDPEFHTGDWKQSLDYQDVFFKPRATTEQVNRFALKTIDSTSMKILYDQENLYFGIQCFDREPGSLHTAVKNGCKGEVFPDGDNLQIFIQYGDNPRDTTQFAFDFKGNKYDRLLSQEAWNATWNVQTTVGKEGWAAFVTIPWESVGIHSAKGLPLFVRGTVIRTISHNKPLVEYSSLGGATAFSPLEFGSIELK